MTVLATIAAVVLVAGTTLTLAEGFVNIAEIFAEGMTKTNKISEEKLANVNWELAFAV